MRETLANQPMQVRGDPRPMRFYVSTLADKMRRVGRLSLAELVTAIDEEVTKETLVGSFCALLELIKIGIVTASEGDQSGEIEIIFAEDSSEDFEHLLDGTTFEDEIDPSLLETEEGEEADGGEDQGASEPPVEASSPTSTSPLRS